MEFLKRELGVGAAFASGILALVNANSTLTKSFLIGVTGVNDGLEAFQEYRFLTIERDTARVLVETAQNKLAEYYLNQVDYTDDATFVASKLVPRNNAAGGYSFSDALNAVSVIEYQCTREGIRYLLNRSINNSPSNMEIDAATGTVMFKSAKVQEEGTGSKAPVVVTGSKTITGAGPDAYEKSTSAELVKSWARFCGFPEATKLGDNNGALRKAILRFLGVKADTRFISQAAGIQLERKIKNGESGCAPAQ